MTYYNRKQRRAIEKKCWRANIKVDDIQAQAAKDMQADASHKTAGLIIHAMSLVLMQNFKMLQKKDTRLENFVSLIHQKNEYLKSGEITSEEKEIITAAQKAFKLYFKNQAYRGQGE